MSYFKQFWQKSRDLKVEHGKAWRRDQAIAWDAPWQALSHRARLAYLTQIKAPTKMGSATLPGIVIDNVPVEVVNELVAAEFVKIEPGRGNRSARIIPIQTAFDFSSRLRSIHRYNLLGSSSREDLTKYVKHAFYNQGETVINEVLDKAKVHDRCRIDEGLELYVTTRRWPEWALESIKSKWAKPLLDALRKAEGPVRLVDLPGLVKGPKPAEIQEALTELIVHLAVFEDLQLETLEVIVGLLPAVRQDMTESARPRVRPPLVVCEELREIGPLGGMVVNDLRIFLLEVAGNAPRLRQDGGIFQKEEPRFLEALPPHPAWLDKVLNGTVERRLELAYRYSEILGFVETESEDNAKTLRLNGKGRNWLSSSIEDQYGKVYEFLRTTTKQANRYDDDYDLDYSSNYGDAKFFGIGLTVLPSTTSNPSYYAYYNQVKPEQLAALRTSVRQSLDSLPVGVYHRWDSVLAHLSFGSRNPILMNLDPSKLIIFLDRRQVARLPEQVEKAGQLFLERFLLERLLPFDAFRPAIDEQGGLCIARLPRFQGYFGLPYEASKDEPSTKTRVIVQPDFSVLVIGLDPAPAAELAPFCERAGGHAGQGILTFKITRESVIRAASHGLTASAIVARVKKHASIAPPENVLREIQEWAGWVRLVNVRPITVVRCPDRDTAARVASVLGKKAEVLSDTLVALLIPKLTPAERLKLQGQGILITKDDITPIRSPETTISTASTPAPVAKKRGRPKKNG